MTRKESALKQKPKKVSLETSLLDIVDAVEDELLVVDSKYRIRFANLAARNRVRQGTGSPIDKLCYKVFHNRDRPCRAPLWNCPLAEIFKNGRVSTIVHPYRIRDVDTYLKITAYPLRDDNGNILGIVELRKDVTLERELETQILKRHHQLSTLSHISSAVSGLQDLDTILKVALDNVLEIINGDIGGILLLDEETKTLRYRVSHGLSAKYVEEMRMSLGKGIAGTVAQTGQPILLEDISKDPRIAHPDLVKTEGIKGFVSIPLKAKEKVVGVMNLASHLPERFGTDDVSLLNSIGDYLGTAIEQAALYERLARVGERYRVLLQHSLNAQEEERKRIARELHDETSQTITSLTLSLQALIQMAEVKSAIDDGFVERLKTTHSYAVHAGKEIVRLMKELRPTLLDELGLPAAIHRYAKDTLEAHDINVSVKFKGTKDRLPPEIEVTLFRAAQGLIGNILEHSAASSASINLNCTTEKCVLRVNDDGKGFNVSKLTQVDSSGRGAGLFTVKERLRLVGGECNIDSRPGAGTRITINVPLAKDVID